MEAAGRRPASSYGRRQCLGALSNLCRNHPRSALPAFFSWVGALCFLRLASRGLGCMRSRSCAECSL